MFITRRSAAALVVALTLVLVYGAAVAGAALSPTERIFTDYSLDLEINGSYDAVDLEAALEASRDNPAYDAFAAAVQDVYQRDILGIETGTGDGLTAQPPEESSNGLIPQPRLPGERDQPPWPFLAMTALAAMLVVTGAGSSIYRRVHR